MSEDWSDGAEDALNRMKRAYSRGSGCYLTMEMVRSLNLTILGEIWNQPDPRRFTERNDHGSK